MPTSDCPFCNMKFMNSFLVGQHVRVSHRDKTFTCKHRHGDIDVVSSVNLDYRRPSGTCSNCGRTECCPQETVDALDP